jgi:hypothetical protein
MLATVAIDALVKSCDAYTYLERLGYIMVASTCIPYALAMVCFLIAGKHYVEFKTCMYHCKTATLEKIKIDDFINMQIVNRNVKGGTVSVKRSRPNLNLGEPRPTI